MSLFATGRRRKRRKAIDRDVSFLVSEVKPTKLFDQYLDQLQLAIKGTPEQYAELSKSLIDVIAQPEMLHTAYRYCRWQGGRAPGPDTIRIDELSKSEVWEICRALGHNIRSGVYRPAEPVLRKIPKIGRSGWREITIYNIADRFVAKAAELVLGPILDHHRPTAALAGVRHEVLPRQSPDCTGKSFTAAVTSCSATTS
jgi:hypothetical protein